MAPANVVRMPSPVVLPWSFRLWFGSADITVTTLSSAREPWRTWFAPDELARELRGLGFTRLEDLDAEALNARFFAGRADRLGGRGVGRVMTATH